MQRDWEKRQPKHRFQSAGCLLWQSFRLYILCLHGCWWERISTTQSLSPTAPRTRALSQLQGRVHIFKRKTNAGTAMFILHLHENGLSFENRQGYLSLCVFNLEVRGHQTLMQQPAAALTRLHLKIELEDCSTVAKKNNTKNRLGKRNRWTSSTRRGQQQPEGAPTHTDLLTET